MTELIQCSCCGEMLPAAQLELTFNMPDDVFAIPRSERGERAIGDSDSYVLDNERFFVRGLIPILVDNLNEYCLGAWAEISKNDFQWIEKLSEDDDFNNQPLIKGTLNNAIPYNVSDGKIEIEVQLQGGNTRPYFQVVTNNCTLFDEQLNGICRARAYEYSSYIHKDRFSLVEEDELEASSCQCCEKPVRLFCGFVENKLGQVEADYWLRLPTGHLNKFIVAISISKNNKPRVAVLYGENSEDGLTYWIQDIENSPWEDFGEFGKVMEKDDVLADQYKEFFFDIVDKIAASDSRLKVHIGRDS